MNNNNLTGTIPSEFGQHHLTTLLLANNQLCVNVNYTSWAITTDAIAPNFCLNCENPCRNEGICNPTPGVLNCTCVGVYEGPTCQYDVQLCRYSPCQNGGTCINGPNSFTCQCAGTGFTGSFCEQEEPFEVPCPPGFAFVDGGCFPCSPGTYRTSAQHNCVPCQKGTNSSVVAAQSPSFCKVCPVGNFAPMAASMTCHPCDDGEVSCPRFGSFSADSPAVLRPVAFRQVILDQDGQVVTNEAHVSLIGYYYLGAFFLFVILSAGFAFLFRKRVRKAVASAAIILKTPMSYMQVVFPSGDVAEVSSFYRGLVGIWVVAGILLVTAYQIHVFVAQRMTEISALQPGTVFTNGVSTYQTSTRLSLKVEFYNTPVTCEALDFSFAVFTERSLPSETSGIPECKENPGHLSVVLTYSFPKPLSFTPGSVVTIQATSLSGSPLFTQAIIYELVWDSYQGRVVMMNETLAETSTNKLGGDGRVGLSAIPTEYLELKATRSQGYTYSKASSSIEALSYPVSDTLSLSLDISVPNDSYFQVQNAEAISGLQFVVGLLALASGVITAGSLGANFFSNVYKRQMAVNKFDDPEEMPEIPKG